MNLLLRMREVRFKDQFDRVCCVTCRPLSLIDTFRRDKKIRNSVQSQMGFNIETDQRGLCPLRKFGTVSIKN